MSDEPQTFRNIVLERINELGISMAEAARISGVSPNILRDLKRRETGSTDVENARKLASALSIPGFGETDQSTYIADDKPNDLRNIRNALAFSAAEMARNLKMELPFYLKLENPTEYPTLPRHIDLQVSRLISAHTPPNPAPPTKTLERGEIIIRMMDDQVRIEALVDAESIARLIAKLEGLKIALTT